MEDILQFKVNKINSDVLEQLKKLEKDGYIERLNNDIEIGDYRFCIYKGQVIEMQLRKILIKKKKSYTFHGKGYSSTFSDSSFGKKIFNSEEEALRVMNRRDDE